MPFSEAHHFRFACMLKKIQGVSVSVFACLVSIRRKHFMCCGWPSAQHYAQSTLTLFGRCCFHLNIYVLDYDIVIAIKLLHKASASITM